MDVPVSFFIALTEKPDTKHLGGGGGGSLAYSWRGFSPSGWRTIRKQGEMDAGAWLAFFLFIRFKTLMHGMVHLHLRQVFQP